MDFKTFLFYAFSVIMLVAATRVITAKNPVHAALFLVLAFFNAAGIWLLLKANSSPSCWCWSMSAPSWCCSWSSS